ncbi:TetR/AcrR family transcriptional regulator [Leifsonia sp. YAF41]|uniref:TetR/AcrR family transcriptional regulator n=1 Tax=Leifsonia sp. YAF41 TaxID=3233086 RepID=UPI003F956F71
MTTAARTPLRKRRQQRVREDLIAATVNLVSTGDLAAATIDRITAESGMSRATLYAHYPAGRDDLLRDTYNAVGSALLAQARQGASSAETWNAKILAYAAAMLEFSTDPRLGSFYNISGPHLVGFRAERGIGSQGFFDAFCEQLRDAVSAGAIDASIDVESTATLLTGSLRDAGIETSRNPARASAFLDSFDRLLVGLTASH